MFVSNIIAASFANYSVYLLPPLHMLRLLVTLVLGLHLSSDQCHAFAEEALRALCNKLPSTEPSPANNGSSMAPSESATFSCGDCTPGTSNDPHVCKYCYKATENEAFSCQGCNFGTMAKPVICDDCKTKPGQASKKSDTGTGCHINFDF